MDAPRTQYAQKALDLASSFAITVGQERLPGGYRLEMAAPDGPSTGGGKQGVQHIALVPEKGDSRIVIGSANHGAMAAELRTFGYLTAMQTRRAPGTALNFDAASYDQLLQRVQQFFTSLGVSIKMVDTPPESALGEPAAPAPVATNTWKWVAIAAGVIALALLAALLLHRPPSPS